MGDAITEADVRLFTTLARFDAVYHGHFKCNRQKLTEMPALWGYARDLFQTPGFGDNTDFDQIKRHYYVVHDGHQPDRDRAGRPGSTGVAGAARAGSPGGPGATKNRSRGRSLPVHLSRAANIDAARPERPVLVQAEVRRAVRVRRGRPAHPAVEEHQRGAAPAGEVGAPRAADAGARPGRGSACDFAAEKSVRSVERRHTVR